MISKALEILCEGGWVLRGLPTNEEEFNSMFFKIVGQDSQGKAIESDNPADFGVTWIEVKAKSDELLAAEPLRLLRQERDRKIAETDWWASSDLTMTDAQAAYRQALRDITNTYSSLDEVVWPTKPE